MYWKARIAYGIYKSIPQKVKNMSRSAVAGHSVYGKCRAPFKPVIEKQIKQTTN